MRAREGGVPVVHSLAPETRQFTMQNRGLLLLVLVVGMVVCDPQNTDYSQGEDHPPPPSQGGDHQPPPPSQGGDYQPPPLPQSGNHQPPLHQGGNHQPPLPQNGNHQPPPPSQGGDHQPPPLPQGGPPHILRPAAGGEGQCPAGDQNCNLCIWRSEQGVAYSLEDFSSRQFHYTMQNPRGSTLKFSLCPSPNSTPACNNNKSPTCLVVPGVKPTSTGTLPRVEQLQPHIPGEGIKLIYEEGEICEVTKQPRVTVITLPCNPHANYKVQHLNPKGGNEGQKEEICRYYVEFPPSQFGCPVDTGSLVHKHKPEIWAVSGCSDSFPRRTTADCHYAAETKVSLHGLNFDLFCISPKFAAGGDVKINPSAATPKTTMLPTALCSQNFRKHYSVYVGPFKCRDPTVLSEFAVSCIIHGGSGRDLTVAIKRDHVSPQEQQQRQQQQEWPPTDSWMPTEDGGIVAELERAVSFKEAINFRERFSNFVELGVGGLKREIDELYRRAFASRGTAPDVLEKLGVSHVKGILLYGPPGSGKTLLARTIAHILGSKQVQLINGPEVISKYLGESEKNLRAHFREAHEAWKQYGPLSDLYVIIIDEIDAICKPRGKTDQSAAGVAYDALVNQLLTLMDGLNEVHNILVVGLTNRRELLDPALLRPGRFEVQIEVGLPDEEGRWEIFEIHTRAMRNSSMLSPDVDLWELAANTTRFSGAEIAGVVRAASSYALERFQLGQTVGSVLVTLADFKKALKAVNPAYTHSESHVLSNYLPLGYLPCGSSHDAVVDASLDLIRILKHSGTTRIQTLLLYGPRGSGKTTLAAHLAVLGKFSYVKIVTASSLMGRPDMMKVDLLYQTFNDAFKSEFGMVILDDLHRLVEYVQVGGQITVSHALLHALTTLLTTTPLAGTKLLVVGTMTMTDGAGLEEPLALGLPDLFAQQHFVALLDTRSATTFISARNIHRSGGGQFLLPSNLSISVQQLLHAIECACTQSHTPCLGGRSTPAFVKQDHLLDCIMAFVTRQSTELKMDSPGLFPA